MEPRNADQAESETICKVCVYIYMCVRVYTYTCVYIYTCVCVCIYTRVCIYTCVCVCLFVASSARMLLCDQLHFYYTMAFVVRFDYVYLTSA